MMRFRIILMLLLALGFSGVARGEPTVTVSADPRSVSVGEPFQLSIVVNDAEDADTPTMPLIEGASVQFAGQTTGMTTRMEIVNGQQSMIATSNVTFAYRVTPQRAGELIVPPITVNVAGRALATRELRVRVSPPERSSVVQLRVEVDNRTPYVGQPVNLRVTLLFNRQLGGEPLFKLPGIEERFTVVHVGERPSPDERNVIELLGTRSRVDVDQTVIDGVPHGRVVMERTLLPTGPGPATIGPSSVVVQVIVNEARGFFESARTRSVTAEAPAISLDVRPLPGEGRPERFSGLVGQFAVSAAASPTAVNVGDPIELSVTLTGPALHERLAAPVTAASPGFEGRFRITPSTAKPTLTSRTMTWNFTVRPATAEVTEVPPIELTYFDPVAGAYRVARSQPIPLQVRATRVVTAGDAVSNTPSVPLGEQVATREGGLAANRESIDALTNQRFDLGSALASPLVLAAVGGPPLAYGAAALVIAARRRQSDGGHARRRARAIPDALASIESAPADDAATCAQSVSVGVRRAVAAVTGHRGTPESLTAVEARELLLQRSPALAEPVHDLLSRCDAARFAGLAGSTQDLKRDAQRLVGELAQQRGTRA